MTTVALPGRIAELPPVEVQPSAQQVLADVRAAATELSDVAEFTAARGAPPDWTGEAAEAAGHAMTAFARRAGVAHEALTEATRAIDAYLDAMADRRREHARLDERRTAFNDAVEALHARVDGAPAEQAPALEAEARALFERQDAWSSDWRVWLERVAADEDRLVARLRSVDTVAEGRTHAAATPDVDTGRLAGELRRLGDDTDAVFSWWNALSAAEQEALLLSDPDLLGNTNGIPAGVRDEANRASLERDVEWLRGRDDLSSEEERWLDNALATRDSLDLADGMVDPVTGEPVDANLLLYLPNAFGGDGGAAVAYGDPDTADHTALVVPGLTNDMLMMESQGRDALELYLRSAETAPLGADGEPQSVATVAWMGYDAPSARPDDLLDWPGELGNVGGVVTEAQAEAGGHRLADFVDGLRSTDLGDRAHLTVVGHSYGSTTAAHSAADGLDADALVLIGSPGAGGGVDHVSGLGMPEDQVYVGSADHDFVTWLGGRDGLVTGDIDLPGPLPDLDSSFDDGLGLGEDPAQADFGAVRFQVDHGEEFDWDSLGTGVANHGSYLDPQTNPTSLDNVAGVVTGNGVTEVEGRADDAHDLLFDWAGEQARGEVDRVVDGVREGAGRAWDVVTTPVDSFRDAWSGGWPGHWP